MVALPGIAIQGQIYESSNSLVYRGISVQDDRAIIIKMLKQDYPSPQELIRYKQEYKITRSLNLKGVVKAYSQQDYQRTLIIFLEDFGGESLEQWRHKRPENFCPMPLSTFLWLAINVTEILGKIHAANVIHKDINPGNIVFNPDTGVVKIIDFGIATQFNRTNPTFKSPHVLEGTLAYLSPEQTGRMNRLLDYRTDFYSLGVTFYELLTGHLPFPRTDILELVHCHIAKQPVGPHVLNATIPKAVSDIILKLMAKNAEERYQSAWGIKADLESCVQQLTETGQIDHLELALHDVSDQFQIPQKLYGRDKEVARLLAVFDRVAWPEENRVGALQNNSEPRFKVEMMLVSGYAGIGKSALVQELYKPITAKRGYFISGKFDQLQRNIPYRAIVDALQKLVQQLLGETNEQVQQWRSCILTALGNSGQLIIDVIPEIELIIGNQPPVPEVSAAESQNRFNRVFQQFVRVFCSREHPLVIFLDDLQWIDSATLKLIELMLDEQTQSLFLIGAYRDNEVSPAHPLALTLERLQQQGAVLQEMSLTPLTLESLSQLIAETLHQDAETVGCLAELVLRKTEGNPLFINEFLRMLYGENLLTFDAEHRLWKWNIAQIEAQPITNNVVELLLIKLRKLPTATQQILQLAACVGAEFNLQTLAIVCEKDSKEVYLDLLIAIQAGLIQPISELDENLLVQAYKFLHDRVQQAAYALIDDSQKQVVHLRIGRNLLENTLPEKRSERLFEIVDHLNHGLELVTEESERDEIARLNLIFGQKAKAAIAYDVAAKYLTAGRAWLAVSSWQTNYELTLKLYLEIIEIEYLCGDFEQVEYWVAIVIKEAKTILDIVKVYEVKIQTDMAQSQPLQAIDTALQVLQQLGISFPKEPSKSDIQLELDTITLLLGEKQIADLSHLPAMTEPEKLAAMRILSSIMIAAQIAAPDLMPLLASKQVNLSIQYGNAFTSGFAYANFGLILCGMVGNIESGYQFGQLALLLLSQSNTHSLRAKTFFIVYVFIIHWKEHIRETSQQLPEGYQSGLETGDLEFAAYCAHTYCLQSFIAGKELVELEHELRTYGEAIHQIKQETPLAWNQIFQQSVLNLMGCSDSLTHLIGEAYNEENSLPQHETDGAIIFLVHFHKLFLCYLFSDHYQALENARKAQKHLLKARGTALFPLYYFYDSLTKLATYPESSGQAQAEIIKNVSVSQDKIKRWADFAPMNHLHKYHLVQAEIARVLGQLLEAEEFYEQAIQGARDNDYLQEEALAYELAAKFYLERGREKFAQIYMKEAHYCYERWGATAKVKDLETCYRQFFPQPSSIASTPIRTTTGTTSGHSDIAFDLAALMKASQAISSEIELDRLLHSLMKALIENAGARSGFLILENSQEWVIQASSELSNGDVENAFVTQVLKSIPIANNLPESIIQYVIRTQEYVILNAATREGNFVNEPYIQHHQTQSIFCLPLLHQGKLVGVLYLENQLAAGAFTPERSQVLHLLSTQAAIAIENAKLYAKLRASESKLAQFLEAVPVGIGVVDTLGHPCYANQLAIELLGKGVVSAATPDQLAEVYQLYLAGTEQPYPIENLPVMRALSGERTRIDDLEIHQHNATIPVEGWGTPIFDEQGNVVYAISAFQDITERKQAEAALQESEARYRLLFENNPNPMWIYDDETLAFLMVNDAAVQYYGYSADEFLTMTVLDIRSSSDVSKLLHHVGDIRNASFIHSGEWQHCRKDGTVIDVEITSRAIPWSGIAARCVLVKDITERKRTEGLLADYNQTLEQQVVERTVALQTSEATLGDREQELRLITDALPVCIFYTDPNHRYQFVNRNCEVWFECSREEILGKHSRELLGEAAYQTVEPYIKQVLGGQITTYEAELSYPSGKKHISAVYIPDFDANSQVRGYYGLISDISDRKRAEEASILEERNRMAREIHDTLAQAWASIIVHLDAASQRLTLDPDAAQSHLKTGRTLARSGLADARRSVEALRPRILEEGDLQSALDRLAAQMFDLTPIQVVCETIGEPYALPREVETNLLRIGQEALTNAFKYANASEIRVELRYERSQCLLQIKDNGQGFESSLLSIAQGFGLLGMTERAERIGAELTIQSHPGKGTEIIVRVQTP